MSRNWSSGYVTEVNYTYGFYQELIPSQLRFSAISKGFQSNTKMDNGITYCELGCGQGVTANLLAAANPEIQVYATDFNPGHAYNARRLAEEASLSNVHFYDDSFSDFEQRNDLPKFNIISLHGIYSWIGREHRSAIIRFLDKRLKPGGLVYISYNCLPGWAGPAPMRHLMHLHAERQKEGPLHKLDEALDFLEELQRENARYFKSVVGIEKRIKDLRDKDKNYLIHEYLNREWNPFYHSDVASDLSEARLSYVSSMNIIDHVDDVNFTPSQQEIIDRTSDEILKETIRDYISNRQFRKDLFCRGPLTLPTHEAREEWLDTPFVLTVRAQDVSMKVKSLLGEVSIQAQACKPLIDAIDAAGGHASLRELIQVPAVARLGWARLQRIIRLLVASHALHPGPVGALDVGKRRDSTARFNKVILARSAYSDQLRVLASPVTGGGATVGRLSRLFLLAHVKGESDQVNFVWNILKKQGEKLTKDKKPLETDAENLSLLHEQNETFMQVALPVLRNLGII